MSTTNKTDTIKSSPNKGLGPEPTGGRKSDDDKRFCTKEAGTVWKLNGWECFTYRNNDSSSGYVVTNGQSAIHLDNTGNINLSTAKPPQAGVGGQFVVSSTNQFHNVNGSMLIHCKGAGDATREKDGDSKSGESTTETPAYSLMAEGDIFIEASGSEVAIKADNITLNAINTLTLKAGEAINVECGNGNGKFNLHAGDMNVNAAFNNKTITGAEYTDGPGEQTTNQIKPGSIQALNSAGSINQMVRGDYYMGVLGHYNLKALGNMNLMAIKGGLGIMTTGKIFEGAMGPKSTYIVGKPTVKGKPPKATYEIKLGPNKFGLSIVSAMGFSVYGKTGSTAVLTGATTLIKTKGIFAVKSPTIFLN